MLNETRLIEDEYEKQYYGFSSTDLYVNMKERASRAIKIALKEVETTLINEGVYNESLREQKLAEMYFTYMQKAKIFLEEFKTEGIKIFAIPENVVLDEDLYKSDLISNEDINRLRKEIAELETELLRQQVFLAECKHHKQLIDSKIYPAYEKANFVLKSLKKLPGNLGMDENRQKLIDHRTQYIHYYFSGKGDAENFQPIRERFVKIKELSD